MKATQSPITEEQGEPPAELGMLFSARTGLVPAHYLPRYGRFGFLVSQFLCRYLKKHSASLFADLWGTVVRLHVRTVQYGVSY
jgi:hypothetical protein